MADLTFSSLDKMFSQGICVVPNYLNAKILSQVTDQLITKARYFGYKLTLQKLIKEMRQ